MSRMNNDLISRKSLIENLNKFAPEHYTALVNDLIMKEPTAFDKEKVIEHITNLANAEVDMSDDEEELVDVEDWFDEGRSQGRFEAYRNSVEIVKKGGVE